MKQGEQMDVELMFGVYYHALKDYPADVVTEVMLNWHKYAKNQFVPKVPELLEVIKQLDMPRSMLIRLLENWDEDYAIRARIEELETYRFRNRYNPEAKEKFNQRIKAEKAKLANAQ